MPRGPDRNPNPQTPHKGTENQPNNGLPKPEGVLSGKHEPMDQGPSKKSPRESKIQGRRVEVVRVFYLTSLPVPGFEKKNKGPEKKTIDTGKKNGSQRACGKNVPEGRVTFSRFV